MTLTPLLLALVLALQPATKPTKPTTAASPPVDLQAAADALRGGIEAAYKKGDVAAMARYLHPDVVVIFPDGRVLEGVGALRDYYQKMLTGPGAVVKSYESDPKVTGRAIHGDAVVSHGLMNDRYVLSDGTALALHSVFTVTLVRTPDGPPETGGLVIRSFHSSTDAFYNPVLGLAARKAATWAAAVAGAAALLIGAAAGWLLGRRRKRGSPQSV